MVLRKFWTVLGVVCALLLLSLRGDAASGKRLALVIGNGAYGAEIGPLANPVNDARLMARTLKRAGFEVTTLENVDQKAMKRAISDFGADLRGSAVGLFYYAGHGFQAKGQNWLVPIGAQFKNEADADIEAVAANAVLSQMEEAGTAVNIIVLDACRNPLMVRQNRSFSRGLTQMTASARSFIAYSTAPGEVAADGTGQNSRYTEALAQEIEKGGRVEDVFKRVRQKLAVATSDRQVPWDSTSLIAEFVFGAPGQAQASAPPATTTGPASSETLPPGQLSPPSQSPSRSQPPASSTVVITPMPGAPRIADATEPFPRAVPTFYGGNGSSRLGSGLNRVGEIYNINSAGDLRWFRYGGFGQSNPAGSVPPWHPNSGNPIGNGWGDLQHVMGCGNGVILAIDRQGLLRWYQYDGQGIADRSGRTGWSGNSGNPIGNGWNGQSKVFCSPREGFATATTIYAISRDGVMRWYRYNGDGTNDPSGRLGWETNSGNQISYGWEKFSHVFAAAGAIFAIEPNGVLRYYAYTGRGEQDPLASRGWSPNSGNPISYGWEMFKTVFGGTNDTEGWAAILYGVKPDGALNWYRYSCNGESDPTASRSDCWHVNSGNQIGNGW
jgi:hypothetical protein